MSDTSSKDYLLGTSQAELERLRFQHGVWNKYTGSLWDRLGVQPGWQCLDVGAGPGFVALDLAKRVGSQGRVTLLEPSESFLRYFSGEEAQHMQSLYTTIKGTVEEAVLPDQHFDFIFVRWVIAFVAEPEVFLEKLVRSLKPGGVIALQDYYYEGLSLYPKGGPFDKMPDIVRRYYHSVGGDPYITGKIPGWLRKYGLKVVDYTPHARVGGPDSELLEWAYRFFSIHLPVMAKQGLISSAEADALIADLQDHREDPDTLFFSPLLVDVAGCK
jgi:SAM-dependent methyltransferase